MRYNAQPANYPEWGSLFPIPCDVLDANGVNVGPVVACDTDTGELIQHVRDASGMILVEDDGPVTRVVKATPPLTIVSKKP